MEDDTKKTGLRTVKAIVIEIGIIAVLVVAVIAILNYLRLIDVASIFPKNPKSNTLSKSVPVEKGQEKSVSHGLAPEAKPNYELVDFATIAYNPSLPKLDVVTQSKSLQYAAVITQIEGKISQISLDSGIDNTSNLPFEKRLVIEVGKDGSKIELLYPKEAESKIRVLNQQNRPIKFTDLAQGDEVFIRTEVAILRKYPKNINDVIITKK